MPVTRWPECGSGDVVLRNVNDLFRAALPYDQSLEIRFQVPMWNCMTCKLGWQGDEALAAKESAYQHALVNLTPMYPVRIHPDRHV